MTEIKELLNIEGIFSVFIKFIIIFSKICLLNFKNTIYFLSRLILEKIVINLKNTEKIPSIFNNALISVD